MPDVSATKLRVLFDGPSEAAWNMAVDETILLTAQQSQVATLRFYSWARPTLSLGYFQRVADRDQHAPSQPCDCVRRASGGGAIVHHHELTYSLAMPTDQNRFGAVELYDAMHETLKHLLAEWDVHVTLAIPQKDVQTVPFLCFERRTHGDVLADPHKIAGRRPQRRQKNAILQHGSVLLCKSPNAPELPGLIDLHPALAERTPQLAHAWADRVCTRLQVAVATLPLTEKEQQAARSFEKQRFGNPHWTRRR